MALGLGNNRRLKGGFQIGTTYEALGLLPGQFRQNVQAARAAAKAAGTYTEVTYEARRFIVYEHELYEGAALYVTAEQKGPDRETLWSVLPVCTLTTEVPAAVAGPFVPQGPQGALSGLTQGELPLTLQGKGGSLQSSISLINCLASRPWALSRGASLTVELAALARMGEVGTPEAQGMEDELAELTYLALPERTPRLSEVAVRGRVLQVEPLVAPASGVALFRLLLQVGPLQLPVQVRAADLMGEPSPDLYFRGRLWLHGRLSQFSGPYH